MILSNKVISIIEKDMCELFRIDPDEMFNLKMDYGMQYLDRFCKNYPSLRESLPHTAIFWKWYRMVWSNTDRTLMSRIKVKKWGIVYSYPVKVEKETWTMSRKYVWEEAVNLYKEYHQVNSIKMKLRPNSMVINRALIEQELAIN